MTTEIIEAMRNAVLERDKLREQVKGLEASLDLSRHERNNLLETVTKQDAEIAELHRQVPLLRKGFIEILTNTCEKFPGQRFLQIMSICNEALTATQAKEGLK